MLNNIYILGVLLVVVLLLVTTGSKTEQFATSPGTILQLMAKGVQDAYLTGLPRYSFDYSPYYYNRSWTRRVPYYFYSRAPPTYIGGRPIYGRPFYTDRPIYYAPLTQRWY